MAARDLTNLAQRGRSQPPQGNVKVRGTIGLTPPTKRDAMNIVAVLLRGEGQTRRPPDFDVALAFAPSRLPPQHV